jgi:hypothetical protein
MERQFDYTQKILVAVEFGQKPRELSDMPASYAVFQRVPVAQVFRTFEEIESLFVRLVGGRKFHEALDQHMGYWEKKVPAGQECFVHYAIGKDEVINSVWSRLKDTAGQTPWVTLGVYHVEPQSSGYPGSFPFGPAMNHLELGTTRGMTKDSIFWFNFFPAQPYLFEKTYKVWMLFYLCQLKESVECNQLVAWEGKDRLISNGVDEFVQVNLNRFSSMAGYFGSAQETGKTTFTSDADYLWYGMVLRKL